VVVKDVITFVGAHKVSVTHDGSEERVESFELREACLERIETLSDLDIPSHDSESTRQLVDVVSLVASVERLARRSTCALELEGPPLHVRPSRVPLALVSAHEAL